MNIFNFREPFLKHFKCVVNWV